jgi:hypothetical protein
MVRRLRESNNKYLKERYGKQPTLKELCEILASIGGTQWLTNLN